MKRNFTAKGSFKGTSKESLFCLSVGLAVLMGIGSFTIFVSSRESPSLEFSLQPMKSPSAKKALTKETKAQLLKEYGKLPLSFEKNEGQVDREVKYLSRGHGYALYLGLTSPPAQLRLE